MKKFVLGFLTAVLLFSAIPVGAAVQQYILSPTTAKLVVDGVEVKDAKLPMMNYQGYNYIPAATFRAICDKIGAGFKWDGVKSEIQINTKVTNTIAGEGGNVMNETTANLNEIVIDISSYTVDPIERYQKDGITVAKLNGIEYVKVSDIVQFTNDKYVFGRDKTTKGVYLAVRSTSERVLENIPITFFQASHVTYEYYFNIILPLIK